MEHSKSRRNFLKIVGLGSVSLFTKSQAIGLPNNLVHSNIVNTSNLAIDPVTAMTVAQFAFSAYQTMQGGAKDPLDAIVGMFLAMNEKLDVIKGQLDFIYKEMLRIPKETVYLMHLSQMVGVFEQLPVVYKQYNLMGKRKFIGEKKDTINDHLTSIQRAFNNLKSSFDPVTVSYIVICSRVDFELSKLIDKEEREFIPQMEAYLNYFKNALWLNHDNLPGQAAKHREKVEKWRRNQSMYLIRAIALGKAWMDHYQLKSSQLDSSMFNASELHIVEQLYQLGLLTKDDQNIKSHYEISTFHFNRAKEESRRLIEEGYMRPNPNPNGIWVNWGNVAEDQVTVKKSTFDQWLKEKTNTNPTHYINHFTMLLSILAAQQAAIDAVKFLNNIILLKK